MPRSILFLLVLGSFGRSAIAQPTLQQRLGGAYYGPRVGLTAFGNNVKAQLDRRGLNTANAISQFGWQWEQRFVIGEQAPVLATSMMLLVGGVEQSVFLPSLTWLIGIRGVNGSELGVGPNVSLAGAGLAIGTGITKVAGEVNVPVNVAIVVGEPGLRLSVMTGFNMNRRRFRDPEP